MKTAIRLRSALVLFGLCFLALSLAAEPSARFVWAATGPAKDPLKSVVAVRASPDGRIWVADSSDRFFVFDRNGAFLETWGSSGTGPGQFTFHYAHPGNQQMFVADFLFLPDGSLLVGDLDGRIQRFDRNRRFLGEWASVQGKGVPVLSLTPYAQGEVLVAFLNRPDLYRYDYEGRYLGVYLEHPLQEADWEITGKRGQPGGVAFDARGRVYLGDAGSRKQIRVFGPDGRQEGSLRVGAPNLPLADPGSMLFDRKGNLFVSDQKASRVVVFGPDGQFRLAFGGRGHGDGQFNWTSGLALDGSGGVYAGDWYGYRLLKFELGGL